MALGLRIAWWMVSGCLAVMYTPGAEAAAPPQVAGQVISIQGRVEVMRAAVAQPATIRQDLYEGDAVRTGPDSRAAILLADESRIKLNANTTLRIKTVPTRPARGIIPAALRAAKTVLELIVGEIWVQTSDPPPAIEIETPTVTATIRGTEVNLSVAPDGESKLSVLSGQVEYRNPFGTVLLQGGELGIARKGQAPQRQVLLNPEEAVQWSLYYPGIISFRDYPMVTADRARLEGLLPKVRSEAAASPGDLERQAHVGEILHDLGRREEARSIFESVTKITPTHVRSLNGLGWIALQEGRVEQAIMLFTAVSPPTQSSLLGLSLARFRRGEIGPAASHLDEATKRFGPSPPILTQLALLDLLIGEINRARQRVEEALRLEPNFALAHGLRSNIALTQNRKDEALEAARKAVEVNPFSPSAYLDLSLALQAHFQLDDALNAARKAVELDPTNARAQIQVARLLIGFDRIEEAWEAARRAQALEPTEPLFLTTIGFILLARYETAAAVTAFERAIDAGSTYGEPYIGLGLASFRQGRTEAGLRHFQAAVLMEPRVSLFHSYLGKALYQLGRREDWLVSLERATALDPRDPTPHFYKGIFLTDLNRPAEAIESLQHSVALNDNRAVYRSRLLLDRDLAARNVDLARTYAALGQIDRALAASIRALHEDPQSDWAHRLYGNILGFTQGAHVARNSELLQTRMLIPVNQNSFATHRRYTFLLEQPRLEASAEATWGRFDSQNGGFEVTAATERIAGVQSLSYFRTDGPKPRNSDEKGWSSFSFLKWAPTFRSGALFEMQHSDNRSGDISANQRAFTPNDPDSTFNAHETQFGLGYRLQTQPENNLLLYAQGQLSRFRLRDRSLVGLPIESDLIFRQPFYNLQASYLHRFGNHQLWFAADYFNGQPEESLALRTTVPFPIEVKATDRFRRQDVSLLIQDTWQAFTNLNLTGALRYNNAHDRIIIAKLKHNSNVFSPQFGLLWRVTPAHTLRLAAFKNFQVVPHSSLLPANVAGFFIDPPRFTALNTSAVTRQYHVAWDGDLTPTTFFGLGAFRRDYDLPNFRAGPSGPVKVIEERLRAGATASINQIIGRHWGAALNYLHLHRDDPGRPADDDLLRLGLYFVRPFGLTGGAVGAGASVTYVQQDLGPAKPRGAPRDFWITNFVANYEFPNKWAVMSVGVQNLFGKRFDLRPQTAVREDITVREPLLVPGFFVFNDVPPRSRFLVTFRVNF